MSLVEKLKDLSGAIATALAQAPDRYPEWSYNTYESNKADILELWSEVQPQLTRDLDKSGFIDERLKRAFAAYDTGDRTTGEQAMADIYNLGLRELR